MLLLNFHLTDKFFEGFCKIQTYVKHFSFRTHVKDVTTQTKNKTFA